eukprot:gnl/MRDRNA2_/MRDRNA2_66593_c0_seq1.p1 gnl/MRDRNA2_/MRDRNA2_66593_c0~~gnl/MRDRNA2_/MRDRNA2_66593_c0_seq1.p1  ORF type:complete len:683 (-),score=153.11 gnl/MRDRNA2_/MRDRNA2_66593_c0_seq1:92-1978(-)
MPQRAPTPRRFVARTETEETETQIKVQTALIQVFNTAWLQELATYLISIGVQLISNGRTASTLQSFQCPVLELKEYNKQNAAQGRQGHIDLLIVNLYPLENINPEDDFMACVGRVDQLNGGAATNVIRNAAKNYAKKTIVTSPQQYAELIDDLRRNNGRTSHGLRKRFAEDAWSLTAAYDASVCQRCGRSIHIARQTEQSNYGDREKGFVMKWNAAKGFGFVQPDDGSASLFCHVNNLANKDQSLRDGDEVIFIRHYDKRRGKYQAQDVRLASGFGDRQEQYHVFDQSRGSNYRDTGGRDRQIGLGSDFTQFTGDFDRIKQSAFDRGRTFSGFEKQVGGSEFDPSVGPQVSGLDYDRGHGQEYQLDGGREHGKVLRWNHEKGFGFILSHTVKDQIFCHKSDLRVSGRNFITEGEEVTFERHESDRSKIDPNVRKYVAKEVWLANEEAIEKDDISRLHNDDQDQLSNTPTMEGEAWPDQMTEAEAQFDAWQGDEAKSNDNSEDRLQTSQQVENSFHEEPDVRNDEEVFNFQFETEVETQAEAEAKGKDGFIDENRENPPSKRKRAKSAYNVFCAANRARVKAEMGEGAKPAEVTSELGRLWRELKDDPERKEELASYGKQAAESAIDDK